MTKHERRTRHGAMLGCLLLTLLCMTTARAQEVDRKILKKVEVHYPSVLKSRGIGGTVRLKVVIHGDGTVKDIQVLGGNPALADAAEKAVRQWKFAPGGESTMTVAVAFDPNS
ncbi:MAG: energy transducer TonB [Candidatus Acidiferrum sp.]